jgi:hypothetical protein
VETSEKPADTSGLGDRRSICGGPDIASPATRVWGGDPFAHFAVAIAFIYIAVEVLHKIKRLEAYKAAMILIALNASTFCIMCELDPLFGPVW